MRHLSVVGQISANSTIKKATQSLLQGAWAISQFWCWLSLVEELPSRRHHKETEGPCSESVLKAVLATINKLKSTPTTLCLKLCSYFETLLCCLWGLNGRLVWSTNRPDIHCMSL